MSGSSWAWVPTSLSTSHFFSWEFVSPAFCDHLNFLDFSVCGGALLGGGLVGGGVGVGGGMVMGSLLVIGLVVDDDDCVGCGGVGGVRV